MEKSTNLSTYLARMDVFHLLGIKLDESEQVEYIERMTRIVLDRIVKYALEDGALTEEDLKYIDSLGSRYIAVQEEIQMRMKNFNTYITNETFNLKIEMFLKQINDFEAFLIDRAKTDTSIDMDYVENIFQSLRTTLVDEALPENVNIDDDISMEEPEVTIFKEDFQKYQDLKLQYQFN